MASVKVAVRVRPLNKREKQLASSVVIRVKGNTTYIDKSPLVRGDELKDRGRSFSFDFSYDSTDTGSPAFASQERISHDLGSDVLRAAFEGFNACVFAYGQTGSGKSYTMMGHKEDLGLIPRICEGLFQEMSDRSRIGGVSYRTEVSFLEIYNERVQDLLKSGGVLRVREHPSDGPYVENLSKHVVHNHSEMEDLIILGNTNRTTARTGMNDFSSRSHAIFTITFTQAWFDVSLPRETLSKIHLVDLAGSERAGATRTTGTRLKEGASINKSLVTLGSVISALADLSVGGPSAKRKKIFIPYRDSVLTWLLKDSLGGNSITTMIATVSPADVNYGETLSTLRYASRAKSIVNSPTVNEVGSVKVIRELQAEVARLQGLLEEASQASHRGLSSTVKVEQQLHQNEAKVSALTEEWTRKWEDTHRILQEVTVALGKKGSAGVLDCGLPHLISLDEDPLSTGIVLYYIKDGKTMIGSDKVSFSQQIVLHGPGVLREHCVLESCAGTVALVPQEGARCSVNGAEVTSPRQLTHGALIKLGRGATLRFNHPSDAARLKEERQNGLPPESSLSLTDTSSSTENLSKAMLHNPGVDAKATPQSKSFLTCASPEELMAAATPGKYPVFNTTFDLDGDAPQGGVSTRDGQEQEKDSCHKSGLRLVSEEPQAKALSGAGAASYKGEDRPGDANLQQTSVLGPGDGCDTQPEGNANEIQGVVADCYEGRPRSGGSSLGGGGTSPMPILPQTSAAPQLGEKPLISQEACCPPEESAFEGRTRCGRMEESDGLEETPRACATEASEATRRRSLVRTVSCMVQDAGRLLWDSPAVFQQVRKEGFQPLGARLSSHVVALVSRSSALSVVKDSLAFSVVRRSFVFSLVMDSFVVSAVKDLPLVQHIQKEINQHLQLQEAAQMIQSRMNPQPTQLPAQAFGGDNISAEVPQQHTDGPPTSEGQNLQNNVPIAHQSLIEFPAVLLDLPLPRTVAAARPALPPAALASQNPVAVFRLNVADCGRPEPRPAALLLTEADLYVLTADSGPLVLFRRLPLVQLKEVQVGFAGLGLRLTGAAEEGVLGVYTHSQRITKDLCCALLRILCPGGGTSHHPLLHGDLMQMSLSRELSVPDLLLDAGLRVCCEFQQSLADLVDFLHCSVDQSGEAAALGDVQMLLYVSVGVRVGPSPHPGSLAQLLLTDTHLGLLQEDAVFHPAPRRPQFRGLTLRPRSDIRRVLPCDEGDRRAVGLDVILANAQAVGHPEGATRTAGPSAHASSSPPDAEVWKLTFSCSAEAARLINHLSNV
ncbi:uncharacterized protein kif16bb isoform X2 [Betta splendens]|uniref:Uncharacterized protein kif16bb isoform X2 n=1 Tax=Betta splendens TaxID=158456 RepID=A0A6P7PG01_BETSP|nr:uncharacterized protein kif16bb isoform X2 [Betta splendens]